MNRAMNVLFSACALAAMVLQAVPAGADTISALGFDSTTAKYWRSPPVAKSPVFDPTKDALGQQDNIYGASGYYILKYDGTDYNHNGNVNLLSSLPAFIDPNSLGGEAPAAYALGGGKTTAGTYTWAGTSYGLDDPTRGLITTGPNKGYAYDVASGQWWNDGIAAGNWLDNALTFTLATNADFVLTVLTQGNIAYGGGVRSVKVSGPGGPSDFAQVTGLTADFSTRHYSFIEINGNAGDTFSVSMESSGGSTNFDGFGFALVPEPSTVVLLATGLIGLLCYAWRKRR